MKNQIFRRIGVTAILLPFLFISLPAFAKGKPGGTPGGFEKGEKKGWGESKVPPGWSKGEKKGWDGKEVPPGLAGRESEEV